MVLSCALKRQCGLSRMYIVGINYTEILVSGGGFWCSGRPGCLGQLSGGSQWDVDGYELRKYSRPSLSIPSLVCLLLLEGSGVLDEAR